MNKYVLGCTDLYKSYTQDKVKLEILAGVNLQVFSGETISIMGSSGSGKSTLLHILAGLDLATDGEVIIDGHTLSKLNDNQICRVRNQSLGFIYQFHHLLPEFTALENVLMPLLIHDRVTSKERKHAIEILKYLGLSNRVQHFPGQLSGGERQRVAIARAVVNDPKIIFADEPTGNLDNYTGNQVLKVFFQLQQELKTSVIIVTHDPHVASKTTTQYRLHNGLLSPLSNQVD